jgi:hypothetical protein
VLPGVRREVTRLIFTVPYAGHDVLVIASGGRVAGIAYDPLSTSPPTTWLSDCERCLLGDRHVPLKVRRAVRCLTTLRRSGTGFSVRVYTGKKCSHVVRARRHLGNWVLTVQSRRDESLDPLVIDVQGGVARATSGRPRDYRSPVLLRTLRMLLTAREASDREMKAVLQGLPRECQPRRHDHDDYLLQVTNYARISVDGVPQGIVLRD